MLIMIISIMIDRDQERRGTVPVRLRPVLPVLALLSLAPAAARSEPMPLVASDAGALATRPDAAIDAPAGADLELPHPEHGKAFTGDATPVDPGHVEVEFVYAPTWWGSAGAVDQASGGQHPVTASLAVGLLPNLDARLVTGWAFVHEGMSGTAPHATMTGLLDTTLATRWRFLSLPRPSIDLAVALAVTAPTGTRPAGEIPGTGSGSWSVGGALLGSADWGRFTVNAELGFSAPLHPVHSNDAGLLVCNAAVGYQWLHALQPEVELNYQHEIELGEERDERVLSTTVALVIPMDPVRLVVGARFPLWAQGVTVGPTATAALKFAF